MATLGCPGTHRRRRASTRLRYLADANDLRRFPRTLPGTAQRAIDEARGALESRRLSAPRKAAKTLADADAPELFADLAEDGLAARPPGAVDEDGVLVLADASGEAPLTREAALTLAASSFESLDDAVALAPALADTVTPLRDILERWDVVATDEALVRELTGLVEPHRARHASAIDSIRRLFGLR